MITWWIVGKNGIPECWKIPGEWVTAPLDANAVEQFRRWLDEVRPYEPPLPEPDAIVE